MQDHLIIELMRSGFDALSCGYLKGLLNCGKNQSQAKEMVRDALGAADHALDGHVIRVLSPDEVTAIRVYGLSVRQIGALSDFYRMHTLKDPTTILDKDFNSEAG